jgi:hypothetical protein
VVFVSVMMATHAYIRTPPLEFQGDRKSNEDTFVHMVMCHTAIDANVCQLISLKVLRELGAKAHP